MSKRVVTCPVAEAILEYWGTRCEEHDDECPCCRAWAEYDRYRYAFNALMERTISHDVFYDEDNNTVAAVSAADLSRVLEIIKPRWWEDDDDENAPY